MDMNSLVSIFKQILKKESNSLYEKISLVIICKSENSKICFPENIDLQIAINNSIYSRECKLENCLYTFICYLDDKSVDVSLYDEHSIEYLLLEDIVSILIQRVEKSHKENMNILLQKHELLLHKTLLDYFIIQELPDINVINYISAMAYEKNSCYGRIIFVPNKKFLEEKMVIQFNSSLFFSSGNSRIIRKCMELIEENAYLVVDLSTYLVTGIVYDLEMKDALKYGHIIEFKGHMNWILYNKRPLVEYVNGGYYFAIDTNPEEDYCLDAKKLFNDSKTLSMNKLEIFCNIIAEAKKQGHGTMIVFSDDAVNESERLVNCNRGIKVCPISLVDNMGIITSITSIDGAVFLDWDFNCYAIGVILDGPAHPGEIGRGARYNSAMTYVQWKNKDNCICAVVISEDGMVNLIY